MIVKCADLIFNPTSLDQTEAYVIRLGRAQVGMVDQYSDDLSLWKVCCLYYCGWCIFGVSPGFRRVSITDTENWKKLIRVCRRLLKVASEVSIIDCTNEDWESVEEILDWFANSIRSWWSRIKKHSENSVKEFLSVVICCKSSYISMVVSFSFRRS